MLRLLCRARAARRRRLPAGGCGQCWGTSPLWRPSSARVGAGIVAGLVSYMLRGACAAGGTSPSWRPSSAPVGAGMSWECTGFVNNSWGWNTVGGPHLHRGPPAHGWCWVLAAWRWMLYSGWLLASGGLVWQVFLVIVSVRRCWTLSPSNPRPQSPPTLAARILNIAPSPSHLPPRMPPTRPRRPHLEHCAVPCRRPRAAPPSQLPHSPPRGGVERRGALLRRAGRRQRSGRARAARAQRVGGADQVWGFNGGVCVCEGWGVGWRWKAFPSLRLAGAKQPQRACTHPPQPSCQSAPTTAPPTHTMHAPCAAAGSPPRWAAARSGCGGTAVPTTTCPTAASGVWVGGWVGGVGWGGGVCILGGRVAVHVVCLIPLLSLMYLCLGYHTSHPTHPTPHPTCSAARSLVSQTMPRRHAPTTTTHNHPYTRIPTRLQRDVWRQIHHREPDRPLTPTNPTCSVVRCLAPTTSS